MPCPQRPGPPGPALSSRPSAQGSRHARLWHSSLEGRRRGCLSPRSMRNSRGRRPELHAGPASGPGCVPSTSPSPGPASPAPHPPLPAPPLPPQSLPAASSRSFASRIPPAPHFPSRLRRESPREYRTLLLPCSKHCPWQKGKQSQALCVWQSRGWGMGG